jgi:hypothetical protein
MSLRTVPERGLSLSVSVVALLTVGQLFWWHNHTAHRSVFSFVMTVVWVTALTMLIVRRHERSRPTAPTEGRP